MGGGIDSQLIIFMMKYQDVGSEFFPPRGNGTHPANGIYRIRKYRVVVIVVVVGTMGTSSLRPYKTGKILHNPRGFRWRKSISVAFARSRQENGAGLLHPQPLRLGIDILFPSPLFVFFTVERQAGRVKRHVRKDDNPMDAVHRGRGEF